MEVGSVPDIRVVRRQVPKMYQSDLGLYNSGWFKSAVQIEVAVAPATPRPATLAM